MTWSRQVGAVFLKDLRQTWWLHVALLLIVSAVALRVQGNPLAPAAFAGWYDTWVPMLAILLVFGVVRSDPPAGRLAFWTTQPLAPSAVATAKLLQPASIALLVIATTVALSRWGGVPAETRPALLAFAMIAVPVLSVITLIGTALSSARWVLVIPFTVAWALWSVMERHLSDWPRYATTPAAMLTLAFVTAGSCALVVAMYMSRTSVPSLLAHTGVLPAARTVSVARTSASPAVRASGGVMPWRAQVWHVFRQSFADSRVSVAVVVIALAVIVTRSRLGLVDDLWIDMLSDTGVRFAIAFHLSTVIRRNYPSDPVTFWSTQPREPTAVATAVLLHGLLMLVMLSTATVVTQSEWKVGAGTQLPELTELLPVYLFVIMPALVFAMFYPPTKMKMTALVPAMLVMNFGNISRIPADTSYHSSWSTAITRVADALTIWAWLPLTACLAALLIWRYRQAEVRSVAPLYSAFVLALVPFALLARGTSAPTHHITPASSAPPLSMTVMPDSDFIRFELHAPRGLPGDTYKLVNWALVVTGTDGKTTRLEGFDDVLSRSDNRMAAVRLSGDSLAIIGGAFARMSDSAGFRDLVGAYNDMSPTEVSGIVAARLEGTIESYRIDEVDRLPLRNGLAFLRNGRRAAMRITAPDTAGPRITVRTRWLGHSRARIAAWPVAYGMDYRHLSFALVNTSRASMLPLRHTDNDWVGTSRQQLGFGVSGYDYQLRPSIWTLPKPPIDSAWLANAELVVGAPSFLSATRISVIGSIASPSPSKRSGRSLR